MIEPHAKVWSMPKMSNSSTSSDTRWIYMHTPPEPSTQLLMSMRTTSTASTSSARARLR